MFGIFLLVIFGSIARLAIFGRPVLMLAAVNSHRSTSQKSKKQN
jgi:hypothetical protein